MVGVCSAGQEYKDRVTNELEEDDLIFLQVDDGTYDWGIGGHIMQIRDCGINLELAFQIGFAMHPEVLKEVPARQIQWNGDRLEQDDILQGFLEELQDYGYANLNVESILRARV